MSLPSVSVRRYLSEADEKEALRVLREQLRHQRRVTSDDVRLAVRAVASRGGRVALPPDFPPSRWVLEFKRVHGFVQFDSFAFGGGGKAAFAPPERPEVPSLRSAVSAAAASGTGDPRDHNRQNRLRHTHSSSDDEKEEDASGSSSLETLATFSSAAAADRRTHSMVHNEAQRQVQLQHGFSQRHRHFLQQQQRRALLVDGHRRNVSAWPADQEEMQSSASSGSENSTTMGPSNRPLGSSVGRSTVRSIRPMPLQSRHNVSNNGSVTDEVQGTTSSVSSSNKGKRGYKLSHTVPAETWEKAIAAVEHQGMSLRAAAKMFGVHFAALHRRVKKRAQGGQAKGSHGYFHPSDETGIIRVVVARAELGVLMTFAELMRLVEAAALRKLPDLSVDSARKLLTRFQSRNEQSIRHIIVDWPPPRSVMDSPILSSDTGTGIDRTQRQPYVEYPGFQIGLRSESIGVGAKRAMSAASMAAAAKTTLFVPPSRVGPLASVTCQADETKAPDMGIMIDNRRLAMINGKLPGVSHRISYF